MLIQLYPLDLGMDELAIGRNVPASNSFPVGGFVVVIVALPVGSQA